MLCSVRCLLGRWVGLDVRSLAVFRIALGVVVLLDLADRAPDLVNFYTDRGCISRSTSVKNAYHQWQLSLFLIGGNEVLAGFLFLTAAASAVCLVLGWHTRRALFATWVFVCSLHGRTLWIMRESVWPWMCAAPRSTTSFCTRPVRRPRPLSRPIGSRSAHAVQRAATTCSDCCCFGPCSCLSVTVAQSTAWRTGCDSPAAPGPRHARSNMCGASRASLCPPPRLPCTCR